MFASGEPASVPSSRHERERRRTLDLLRRSRGNVAEAARRDGVSRRALHQRILNYGLKDELAEFRAGRVRLY